MKVNLAIVGATGAVGQVMRQIVEERQFPVGRSQTPKRRPGLFDRLVV